MLRTADPAWSSLRRGQDYYDEGALMWLRADVQIREQTQGRLSLDDFLRSFFGQRDTEPDRRALHARRRGSGAVGDLSV